MNIIVQPAAGKADQRYGVTVKKSSAAKKNVRRALPPTKPLSSTLDFYLDDINRTLFPLKTNHFLIKNGEKDILQHISRCLNESEKAFSFIPQKRAYAAKSDFHLRRTVKLDG